MRADAAPGVLARVQVGATLPGLAWIGAGLLGGGALLLVAGGLLVGVATRRASTSLTAGGAGPAGPDTGAMPALTGRPGW
jgi:hypothetical protein